MSHKRLTAAGEAHVVWPKSLQHREPVLPLPSSSPYAAN
jgi:hypothetical protein